MYALVGALTLFLILVTFHEYGHYSVARYFKIKIIKFKRRKHSMKQQGHRQLFTEVQIGKIKA